MLFWYSNDFFQWHLLNALDGYPESQCQENLACCKDILTENTMPLPLLALRNLSPLKASSSPTGAASCPRSPQRQLFSFLATLVLVSPTHPEESEKCLWDKVFVYGIAILTQKVTHCTDLKNWDELMQRPLNGKFDCLGTRDERLNKVK